MGTNDELKAGRGKWMALTAAFLGWMFDGVEIGLFPLVARPALADLLNVSDDKLIGLWFAVATAGFLVGAATGGVLFGWLGDRIGRVRAMILSVLAYAVFSGLCGLSQAPWQLAVLRFLSALGMGGEWSLGVALVMEIWPNQSRGLLAGLIGAAANVGFLLIALLGWGLEKVLGEMQGWLLAVGLPQAWVTELVSNSGWRLLMILSATPALLAFFISLCVPESQRWLHEKNRGATSNWAARDLLGVAIGAMSAGGIIYLWAVALPLEVRLIGTVAALAITTVGYLYPILRFLQRAQPSGDGSEIDWAPTIKRMLLGACLSGVPLLATWASIQWAATWADQLSQKLPEAKAYTQISMSIGAILGTLAGAYLGDWVGRRLAYTLLCLSSLGSTLVFFRWNTHFDGMFLATAFVAGGLTASFYGWLPLYLPELFRTRVRATGQGFSYNFGRVLAAVGVLQTGNLMGLFKGGYPEACSIMSLIYIVGVVIIWFAPETRGKPLPE
jgi:MFS family permease